MTSIMSNSYIWSWIYEGEILNGTTHNTTIAPAKAKAVAQITNLEIGIGLFYKPLVFADIILSLSSIIINRDWEVYA